MLREIETFGWMRDPERYHLTVYGTPDRGEALGLALRGHHLSLNFTLAGDKLAVDTPSFFGANPATVQKGAKKGLRALGEEHDAGWALLESLSDAQRKEAVFEERTYGEIVTGNKDKVEPLARGGHSAAKLDEKQRALLWKLIETYARQLRARLAAGAARAREAGRIEAIRFGWAGSTARGKPHYYRVQGPLFLIEYDASQNDGNHIHTVWRDFSGDFGRDLLREHYSWLAVPRTGTRLKFALLRKEHPCKSRTWCRSPSSPASSAAARPRCSTASSRKTTASASP